MKEKELSIVDLIAKLKEFGAVLWQAKLWLIVGAILCGAGLGISSYMKPKTYTAELSFMINDDESMSGGVSSVLSQFGLGGAASKNINFDKILTISSSNTILSKVLFDSVEIKGKIDYLGNHIIDIYNLHEGWNKDTLLRDFWLVDRDLSLRKTNIAIQILMGKLRGDPKDPKSTKLVQTVLNEETTILYVISTTKSSELSVALAYRLYNHLSEFYIEKSIERQQITYNTLKHRADSVYQLLQSSEYSIAESRDQGLGIIMSRDRVPELRNMRRVEMYGAMYAELIKNVETAEFMLNTNTPFFQTLDLPVYLLNPNQKHVLRNAILGIVLGAILMAVFFIGRHVFTQLTQEQNINIQE